MDNQFGVFPARVTRANTTISEEQLVELMNGRGLGDLDAFFFGAEISSTRLDSYFTHMDQSTLLNFADDASDGVSFLDSHDSRKLGMGQSLAGRFEQADTDVYRVLADFYTIPGIEFGGQHSFRSTDDFIRAIRAAIVRDVSVGFYGGKMICDICGEPVWGRTDCPHFPGVEYPIGEQSDETVVATATIKDARLVEVSAVYDGATPEAEILRKAEQMAEDGKLKRGIAELLSRRYKLQFPPGIIKPARWAGTGESKNHKGDENVKDLARILGCSEDEVKARVQALVDSAKGHDDLRQQVEDLQGELKEARKQIDKLEPLAKDGEQYRADLVEQALENGRRLYGKEFDEGSYRKQFETSGLEFVKRMSDDWQAAVKERFGDVPGAKINGDDGETQPQPESRIPAKAYVV